MYKHFAFIFQLTVLIAGLFFAGAASAEIRVTSWNLKHLGRGSQDLDRVSDLLKDSDAILLQEVNSTQSGAKALSELAAMLGKRAGVRFCVALSEIPTDAKERYGILYREDRLSYVTTKGEALDSCPVYAITLKLASKAADKVIREPAVGLFKEKKSGQKFWLATIHTVPTSKKPGKEIPYVFEGALDVAGRFPLIVAGDFNLGCDDPAFGPALAQGMKPALACDTKTSLKQKVRSYSAAYDNLLSRGFKVASGNVIDVYARFSDLSAADIYREISDHAPVTAVFEVAP